MNIYLVPASDTKAGTLAGFAAVLHFPDWYGGNLDALADCLGDLSWLPEEPVRVRWDDRALAAADPPAHHAVREVLAAAESETRNGSRSVTVIYGN